MKGHMFSYKAFIAENLSGEIYLCKEDPRIEDWEHLYYDVCEGVFYATINSDNGIFHDTEEDRWFVVRDNRCGTKWYSSKEEASEKLQIWEITRNIMDDYINSIEAKPLYCFEDTQQIIPLLEKHSPSIYSNYRDVLFIITVTKDNYPITVYSLIKEGKTLVINKVKDIKANN